MEQESITKKYAIHPLLFVNPNSASERLVNVATGDKYTDIDDIFFEILLSAVEPKTIKEIANQAGVTTRLIEDILHKDIILDIDSEKYKSAMLWEKHNWSRAGYLMFSQMNLKYYESVESQKTQVELTEQRRNLMKGYSFDGKYVSRHKPAGTGVEIDIPISRQKPVNVDVLKNRSCSRYFKDKNIGFSAFSKILSRATTYIRKSEKSKKTDDPFFLLNSYYSWTVIYVLVQGVKGVERGVYYYDAERSKLILIKKGINDEDISHCIQGQTWINGGGFSLLIGAHWERYAWIYKHKKTYVNLVIQLGELRQEFITASYDEGLKGWMTPAVTESAANNLCKIDEKSGVDMLYFMKFGIDNQE